MTDCRRFEEEGLLLLERGEPLGEHFANCPDCLAARAAYERLQREIAALGAADEPSPGWQAAVWERIEHRKNRSRWIWALGGVAAATALAAALFLAVPHPAALPSLRQEVIAGGETVRAASPHPGDRLRLHAEIPGSAFSELRIYRNGRDLLLRCPGDASCRRTSSELEATLTIPAPGTYQAVLVLGAHPLPPPGAGLDRDAGAVFAAGGRVLLGEELTVR